MSQYNTTSIKLIDTTAISENLASFLVTLQKLEALLEAAVDFIKVFLSSLLNPIKAVVLLALAAVRLMINQIAATGIYKLFVGPNFAASSWDGILASVGGGFTGFENRIVSKLLDQNDLLAPKLPQGMNAFMSIIYVGVETAEVWVSVIQQFMKFWGMQDKFNVPAPVNLRVTPGKLGFPELDVYYSMKSLANYFEENPKPEFDAFRLTWDMPYTPSNSNQLGMFKSVVAAKNIFQPKDFLIEVSTEPDGFAINISPDQITVKLAPTTPTTYQPKRILESIGGPPLFVGADFKYDVIDYLSFAIGAVTPYQYRKVISKADIKDQLGKHNISWTDTDPLYFRVRSVTNDIEEFSIAKPAPTAQTQHDLNDLGKIAYDDITKDFFVNKTYDTWLYKPSDVVPCAIPKIDATEFYPYYDIYKSLMLGFMLEFDLPGFSELSTIPGFGTLASFAYGASSYKAATVSGNAGLIGSDEVTELSRNAFMIAFVRKIANEITNKLMTNPGLYNSAAQSFKTNGIKNVIGPFFASYSLSPEPVVLSESSSQFSITKFSYAGSGNWHLSNNRTEAQNAMSIVYSDYLTTDIKPSKSDRAALANFLNIVVGSTSASTNYLRWESISLSDLFPPVSRLLYKLEKFFLSLLEAVDDMVKYLLEIIDNIKKKIKVLEDFVKLCLIISELLDTNLTFSILADNYTNTSTSGLVSQIQNATGKPSDEPGYVPTGYSTGLVLIGAYPFGSNPFAPLASLFA